MKNLLKKLGVLGLIVAMITPYVYIPKVEAETATDGCTNELVNYLFMDNSKIYLEDDANTTATDSTNYFMKLAKDATSGDGGYLTYTNFPYHFPEGKKINILSADVNELKDTAQLSKYWAYYNMAVIEDEYTYPYVIDNTNTGGKVFVKDATLSKYDKNNIIFHGIWSRNYGPTIGNKYTRIDSGVALSLQSKLTGDLKSAMKTTVIPAKFNSVKDKQYYNYTNKSFDKSYYNGTLADYFKSVVEDGTNVWEDSSGNKYIAFAITRTIDLTRKQIAEKLDDGTYTFGDGTEGIYSKSSTEKTNSYSAFLEGSAGLKSGITGPSATDSTYFTVSTGTNDVNYYWPTVISVEYQVCPTSSDGGNTSGGNNNDGNNTTQSWNLVYNSNVSDTSVTNMPNNQNSIKIGTDATVDSKVPVREGYAFKGWCKGEKECTSPLKSGDKITSPTSSSTITLYAQWGPSGTTDNKDTGVVSYIIGFAAVGLVAGGIYYISRKKNLFKQI